METGRLISNEVVEANTRVNIKRDLPKLHQRADFGIWKGRRLAIVGGGPSLKKTIDELRAFDGDIVVCGSAHDFVVTYGIIPTYAVVCEPNNAPGDRVTDFLKNPQARTQYFIATCCDPSVFDDLEGYRICMWNNYGGCDDECFDGEPAVNGGSTVTLRAINLSIALGYHEMHFFGFDSCFEDENENHAYFSGEADHKAHAENWIPVRVREGGREFKTSGVWLAQAIQFQEMQRLMGHMFYPIIHGDGLIAEIVKQQRMTQ